MKKQLRPSSKNTTTGNPGMSRTKVAGVAALVILVLAVAGFSLLSRGTQPSEQNAAPETALRASALKDIEGMEFTPDDIMAKFNAFMQDAGAGSLRINELVSESGATEDTYRDIKNNEDLSISMTTRKNGAALTSVSVLAQRGAGKPENFITYCSALMNIFTPTMPAAVRQKVLYDMMGYEEGTDKPLAEENTYIIVETKYIFTYSEQKGLSLRIEQMPELEEADSPLD